MQSILGDLGLESTAAAFEIGQRWSEAVGPEIADHAQPVGLRGGVLEVTVDSSVWCQQLQLSRVEIIAALREVLGDGAPEDLRFRVGYTRRP
jgi:predicted nucleic acid-binding Zn ribbon protein